MSSLVKKFKDMWTPPEDEYDDYDYDYQDEEIQNEKSQTNRETSRHNEGRTENNKVVLFKPERFGEETRAIADELLKIHTIVLNLENTNSDSARRIIDFLSGVAYANGGKIKKVATGTYVITPYNVDLTGEDFLDELENSGVYF